MARGFFVSKKGEGAAGSPQGAPKFPGRIWVPSLKTCFPFALVPGGRQPRSGAAGPVAPYEQPVVPPQVSHFRQVPLRTSVKFPHSGQLSPS